jgi:phage/plasmid-associated DNA primase
MLSSKSRQDGNATNTSTSTLELEKKIYKIYSIENYKGKTKEFINEEYDECELKEVIKLLQKDEGYHFRIKKNNYYTFFGDCDYYKDNEPKKFFNLLISFLDKYYNIKISLNDISYTVNESKVGSYHYSIPKYYCSTNKLKEIHEQFFNHHKEIFSYYDDKKKLNKVVDCGIYKDSWFRYPNQTKEGIKNTEHIIKNGIIKDFIVEYINKDSICIENYNYINKNNKINKKEENNKNIEIKEESKNIKNIQIKKNNFNTDDTEINKFTNKFYFKDEYKILIKLFDECLKQERFDTYDDWIIIGMALKNSYGINGFEIFDYISSKSNKYKGKQDIQKYFDSFIYIPHDGYTIATIYKFALEDNKEKYVEIMKKESMFKDFDLTSTGIAHYIKYLKSTDFIWKDNELYCFNGKYWEKDDTLMRIYIGGELYNFLKNVLVTCFWDDKSFPQYKLKLDKLRSLNFKKEIIETTKECLTNNKIEFDTKYYLFGFENKVYDLNKGEFREYMYDDYISIITGYEWIEATKEQINTVTKIINNIFPIQNERDLYLSILSTGLEGRCLEKFTIANGKGRNGKGLLHDLYLCALGNYGLIANSAILFETNKTGSNPERNNIDKKRFVIFREPPEKSKFENSIVKELTGGGTFSARSHHESKTEKKLYCTIIVECNKKPPFSEEPTQADILRLIDIYFRASFVEDNEMIDEKNYIYKGDKLFKTNEFQNDYKCALLQILFNSYKKYKEVNYKLIIPETIKKRTEAYLELSCNILGWFKDNYELTENKNDIIKMKDLFCNFKESEYYYNLSKQDKRKYNYTFFDNYFETNIFFKKYYVCGDNNHIPNQIIYYKNKNNEK